MDGILVINKPSGMTSHDVVAELRWILKEKSIGHTGTLDPDATGVLVICIGKATKIIQFLDDSEKIYEGTIVFGIQTDSMDASGQIIKISDSSGLTCDEIDRVFASFVGEILQTPPMVSAIKVGGERLYKLARQGKIIDREARKINIFEFELAKFYKEYFDDKIFSKADFLVKCSRGTYIRALASDIGEKLGCGAHLSRLVRAKSGDFSLKDSIELDDIKKDPNIAYSALIDISDALAFMPKIFINDTIRKRFLNGVQINDSDVISREGEFEDVGFLRVYDQNKAFLGIGKAIMNDNQSVIYKPIKVLANQ